MEHAESAMMGLLILQALILHAHCAGWNWLYLSYQVLFLMFNVVSRLIVIFVLHLLCSWFHEITSCSGNPNLQSPLTSNVDSSMQHEQVWWSLTVRSWAVTTSKVLRLPLPRACRLLPLYCLLYHCSPVKNLDIIAAMLCPTQKSGLSFFTASPLDT